MPALDYIVILLFTLMIMIVGLAFTNSGQSMKSFFAAGGALPWWLSGLSLFMSFFSAGTFVVWGSIAYKYGWVAVTIQWMMALGGFVIGFFIAPKWRKAGVLTVGSYIGQRFGPGLKQFYSYIFLVLSFVTTGAFLYPVAKLVNVSTGFSIEWSIIVLGLLIIVYTAAGGLWAVVITDVLQFVILFAAVLIVVPLAIGKIGGISQFTAQAPSDFFNLINGEYTAGFLLAFTLYNIVFIGGNWAYVQRYTSVASPQDAKKAAWLFGTLYLVSPVLWMIPPMIYKVLDGGSLEGLENEGAFLLMCKQVLPKGLLGLMLGGMIFATASSVNTTLNMSAAVFTNDIYPRIHKALSAKNLMRTARISTAVFGFITIGVALLVPQAGGIVEVVLSVGAITGAPLFAPPIWALFSKRQTAFSITATTLLGLGINLGFKFLTPLWINFSLNREQEMLVGVFIPMAILALFEGYYHFRPHHPVIPYQIQPVDVEKQTPSRQQNHFALKVLGIALITTSLMVIILGVIASSNQLLVILVGGCIAIVGGLLYIKYR